MYKLDDVHHSLFIAHMVQLCHGHGTFYGSGLQCVVLGTVRMVKGFIRHVS